MIGFGIVKSPMHSHFGWIAYGTLDDNDVKVGNAWKDSSQLSTPVHKLFIGDD